MENSLEENNEIITILTFDSGQWQLIRWKVLTSTEVFLPTGVPGAEQQRKRNSDQR